jgi:hypothetical protein
MLSQMFTNIADNVTFYFAYGLKRRARFLSDMHGETDFLDWMTSDDEEMTSKTDLLRELQHTVPVLGELPIATILRIRKQEKDAFEAYRDAVTKMSSNVLTSKNVSKKEALTRADGVSLSGSPIPACWPWLKELAQRERARQRKGRRARKSEKDARRHFVWSAPLSLVGIFRSERGGIE